MRRRLRPLLPLCGDHCGFAELPVVLSLLRVVHAGGAAVGMSRYLIREDIHGVVAILRGHGVVRFVYYVRLCHDHLSHSISIVEPNNK